MLNSSHCFKIGICFYLCTYSVSVCRHVYVDAGAQGGQRLSDLLKLEFQAIVRLLELVLGTKRRSLERAVNTLNHGASPLINIQIFYFCTHIYRLHEHNHGYNGCAMSNAGL